MRQHGLDLSISRQGPVEGYFVHGTEASGSIHCLEILD
jgi:hypothetical protein